MITENEVGTKCAILEEANKWLQVQYALTKANRLFEEATKTLENESILNGEELIEPIKNTFEESIDGARNVAINCLVMVLQHHIKESGITTNND